MNAAFFWDSEKLNDDCSDRGPLPNRGPGPGGDGDHGGGIGAVSMSATELILISRAAW